jgi:hypothetical protein
LKYDREDGYYSVHLVAYGADITINNPTALLEFSYQQAVLKMLNTLGLGVKYAHALLPEQVEAVIYSLYHICEMCKWTAASSFNDSVTAAMMKIENTVPCMLHLHKRIIEKILSLVSLGVQESNKAARLRHTELMVKWLNEKAFGEPDDPGTYSVPMDEKTGELGEVKFNDNYAQRVEETLADILPKFLTNASSK